MRSFEEIMKDIRDLDERQHKSYMRALYLMYAVLIGSVVIMGGCLVFLVTA